MTAELSRVDQWLYSTLNNDAQLSTAVGGRIYADEAAEGAAAPMVVYAFLGGADRLLTFNARLSGALFLVRAMGDGSSYDPIEAIADRIDTVLTVPSQGTIVRDVRITSCQREQPHQRKDATFGVPTVYLGGYYRIRFQPSDQ
jgi:hypothetical protein